MVPVLKNISLQKWIWEISNVCCRVPLNKSYAFCTECFSYARTYVHILFLTYCTIRHIREALFNQSETVLCHIGWPIKTVRQFKDHFFRFISWVWGYICALSKIQWFVCISAILAKKQNVSIIHTSHSNFWSSEAWDFPCTVSHYTVVTQNLKGFLYNHNFNGSDSFIL